MMKRLVHLPTLFARRDDLLAAVRYMVNQEVLETESHLSLAADALIRFSDRSKDGGYSIGYHLLHGWDRGYIETTGYIIPTMFDLSRALNRPDCVESALKNGDWLLTHQNHDGSFSDISRQTPAVFDTGQVLIGLHRLSTETNDIRFISATSRAAEWLARQWDVDGWSDPVNLRQPTYLTRSASALLRVGLAHNKDHYRVAAEAFLHQAITKLLPSGLYADSELNPGHPFLLHTIMYVAEGFLDAYEATLNNDYLEAALQGMEPFKTLNLNRDVTLFAYYDANLFSVGEEKNITGLAQWAGICMDLFRITDDVDWLKCARLTVHYLKAKQIRAGSNVYGLLPGSVPLWGEYHRASFPNWGMKFFVDALLKYAPLGTSVAEEHETYVAQSHAIYADKVGWSSSANRLSEFDEKIMRALERELIHVIGEADATVLDLGSGEGRCMRWLQGRHPNWRLIGVDPLISRDNDDMRRGSALSIPCNTSSVDAVFCSIALQHVADPARAMDEVARVLKPRGTFLLFDRNPLSLRGLAKPWHEIRGRWLYNWDSPFRERWYSTKTWTNLVSSSGFQVRRLRTFTDWTGSGIRKVLPINRFFLLVGQKIK